MHRKAGDTCDGRERFAAETKSGNAVEVGRNTNLTRRVTLQTQQRLISGHALPIIIDNHLRLTPAGEVYGHAPGTSVERVLQQFLDHRGGPLNHFAGGDLVSDRIFQDADGRHSYFLAGATSSAHACSYVRPSQWEAKTLSTGTPSKQA